MSLPIVPFADARTEPNAVVIKALDAIIAHVAMTRPGWPENPARLAEFELVSHGRIDLVHVHEGNFRVLGHVVVLGGEAAFAD